MLDRKPACDVFSDVCDELVFKDMHVVRAASYLYPRGRGHGQNQQVNQSSWGLRGKLCMIFLLYFFPPQELQCLHVFSILS